MIKSLPKTSHQLAVCEANFLRLKKILNNFSVNKYLFETINPDSSSNPISFSVIHRTKHTLIIEAKQKIKLKKMESLIIRYSSLVIRLRTHSTLVRKLKF